MGKMHFACVRTEAKCILDRCVRQRQACRGMVQTKEVKEIMSPGELTIRLDRCWVPRGSVGRQLDRLQQIRASATGERRGKKRLFAAGRQLGAVPGRGGET